MKLLSIQIPTVVGREKSFNDLYAFINYQITKHRLQDDVEVIYQKDNKQMSIGDKRQALYLMADAEYSVQIDDDDYVHNDYVKLICDQLTWLKDTKRPLPDCIGYYEKCYINGVESESTISNKYFDWAELSNGNHIRTPFFKTPIKTEICLQVGVNDMRFGEDHDFARRIKPLLINEVFIYEYMYIYRHVSTPHNERYGIK